jgi:hypothetical protein
VTARKSVRVVAPAETENDFLRTIVTYAEMLGYWWTHTPDSRRRALSGTPGAPDLCLLHPMTGALIFAEIKKVGGKQSNQQFAWQKALISNGHLCYLWYPHDWKTGYLQMILEVNAGRKAA